MFCGLDVTPLSFSADFAEERTRDKRNMELDGKKNESATGSAAPDTHLNKLPRVRNNWWREQHWGDDAHELSAEQHIF